MMFARITVAHRGHLARLALGAEREFRKLGDHAFDDNPTVTRGGVKDTIPSPPTVRRADGSTWSAREGHQPGRCDVNGHVYIVVPEAVLAADQLGTVRSPQGSSILLLRERPALPHVVTWR